MILRNPSPMAGRVVTERLDEAQGHNWRTRGDHVHICEACGARAALAEDNRGILAWTYTGEELEEVDFDAPPCPPIQRERAGSDLLGRYRDRWPRTGEEAGLFALLRSLERAGRLRDLAPGDLENALAVQRQGSIGFLPPGTVMPPG